MLQAEEEDCEECKEWVEWNDGCKEWPLVCKEWQAVCEVSEEGEFVRWVEKFLRAAMFCIPWNFSIKAAIFCCL